MHTDSLAAVVYLRRQEHRPDTDATPNRLASQTKGEISLSLSSQQLAHIRKILKRDVTLDNNKGTRRFKLTHNLTQLAQDWGVNVDFLKRNFIQEYYRMDLDSYKNNDGNVDISRNTDKVTITEKSNQPIRDANKNDTNADAIGITNINASKENTVREEDNKGMSQLTTSISPMDDEDQSQRSAHTNQVIRNLNSLKLGNDQSNASPIVKNKTIRYTMSSSMAIPHGGKDSLSQADEKELDQYQDSLDFSQGDSFIRTLDHGMEYTDDNEGSSSDSDGSTNNIDMNSASVYLHRSRIINHRNSGTHSGTNGNNNSNKNNGNDIGHSHGFEYGYGYYDNSIEEEDDDNDAEDDSISNSLLEEELLKRI